VLLQASKALCNAAAFDIVWEVFFSLPHLPPAEECTAEGFLCIPAWACLLNRLYFLKLSKS
jgi:hypothetical protein